MAFEALFIDGFDHYATADLTKKYSGAGSSASITNAVTRHGGQSLRINSGGNGWISAPLPISPRTVVIGFAFYPTTFGNSPPGNLFQLNDGIILLSDGSKNRYRLVYDTAGGLVFQARVNTSDSAGTFATVATPVPIDQWSHIELRVYSHDTAGEIEIRVNGVSAVALTDQAFTTHAAVPLTVAYLCTPNIGGPWYFDDLYIRGATTLEAGGFFGDCKVLTRNAIGPGTAAQLTSSSGNPNWQNVNTALPDLNTYNHSLTPGDKDLYDFAALNDPGAIRAVQVTLLAKKTDAGLRLIVPRIKSGATEEAGAEQALSTDERYHTHAWEVDPATGAAFTAAGVDAAEFGCEVSD